MDDLSSLKAKLPIQNEGLLAKLQREGELFASLPDTISQSIYEHWQKDSSTILRDAGWAMLAGAGLTLISKNPALLGESLAPTMKFVLPAAARLGGLAAATDWGLRIGCPALDTWYNPTHLESNKILLGTNVGTALVDYAAMGMGGFAGIKGVQAADKAQSAFRTLRLDLASMNEARTTGSPSMAEINTALFTDRQSALKLLEQSEAQFRPTSRYDGPLPLRPVSELLQGHSGAWRLRNFKIQGVEVLGAGSECVAVRLENNQVLKVTRKFSEQGGQRLNDAQTLFQSKLKGFYIQEHAQPFDNLTQYDALLEELNHNGLELWDFGSSQGGLVPRYAELNGHIQTVNRSVVIDLNSIKPKGVGLRSWKHHNFSLDLKDCLLEFLL